jgi:hypothetical protein
MNKAKAMKAKESWPKLAGLAPFSAGLVAGCWQAEEEEEGKSYSG